MKPGLNEFEKIFYLLEDMKFTMFSTVSEDGIIHTRPMKTVGLTDEDFEGVLWFFSKKNSSKIHDLINDQHVSLAYSDPNINRYITINGLAFISEDKEKINDLWSREFYDIFPLGPSDSEISLIGVKIDTAQIWDAPHAKLDQFLDFVKRPFISKGKSNETNILGEHLQIRQ